MLENFWKFFRTASRRGQTSGNQIPRAIDLWRNHQTDLRIEFFRVASDSGKPRGLRWSRCEWPGTVRFACERHSGLLTAFAAVVVRFEAIEGGEMEDVEAVPLPRDATGVFHFRSNRWETEGRVLFNMTPDDVIDRMSDQFESLDS